MTTDAMVKVVAVEFTRIRNETTRICCRVRKLVMTISIFCLNYDYFDQILKMRHFENELKRTDAFLSE